MSGNKIQEKYYQKILAKCRARHKWVDKQLSKSKAPKAIDWSKLDNHIKSNK